MIRKLCAIFVFIFSVMIAGAQQFPISSQPLSNAYFFNPAAAGVQGFMDVSLGGRQQWAGIENAPRTYFLYANSALGKKVGKDFSYLSLPVSNPGYYDKLLDSKPRVKHALGGRVYSDSYGAFTETGVGADYAIHLPLKEKLYLALGIGFQFSNFYFDRTKAITAENNDPTYQLFLSGYESQNIFNGRFGVYLYSDRFRFGYSVNQLIPNSLSGETNSASYQGLKMSHFANASYRVPLNKIGITPSASLLYTAHAPLSLYGGLILDYNKLFLITAAYRNEGDLIFGVGLTLLKIVRFTYTYDFPVADFASLNSGSHELLIKLMLNPKKGSNE